MGQEGVYRYIKRMAGYYRNRDCMRQKDDLQLFLYRCLKCQEVEYPLWMNGYMSSLSMLLAYRR